MPPNAFPAESFAFGASLYIDTGTRGQMPDNLSFGVLDVYRNIGHSIYFELDGDLVSLFLSSWFFRKRRGRRLTGLKHPELR